MESSLPKINKSSYKDRLLGFVWLTNIYGVPTEEYTDSFIKCLFESFNNYSNIGWIKIGMLNDKDFSPIIDKDTYYTGGYKFYNDLTLNLSSLNTEDKLREYIKNYRDKLVKIINKQDKLNLDTEGENMLRQECKNEQKEKISIVNAPDLAYYLGGIHSTLTKLVDNKASDLENDSENNKVDIIEYKQDSTKIEFPSDTNSDEILEALKCKGALLLIGVPGTGKTKAAKYLARLITNNESDRLTIVQFSETTSYSNFIEGLAPVNGEWKIKNGYFKDACERAAADPSNYHVIIIDEINRGKTESIIGEMMSCIEDRDNYIITNNGNKFKVPKNLLVIGTMNSTDNSTMDLDSATLSRFIKINMNKVKINALEDIKPDASDELKLAIEYVYESIQFINDRLRKDIKKEENIIGARPLYTDYNDVQGLYLIVKYDIRPTAENNCKALDKGSIEEISNKLNEVESKLLKGDYSEA